MRTVACFAPILLAATLGAGEMRAQACFTTDNRIGDFQFVMPTGWKRAEVRGNAALIPGDLRQGSVAQIGLLPAQPLNGDLRSWFNAEWAALMQGFRAIDAYDPQSDRTAEGLESLRAYSRVSNPSFGFGTFVLGAVRVGTRVEAYYFFDNSGRSSYLENDLPSFEHSLRFTTASSPTPTDAGLDGLYIGYRMRGATPSEETHFEYLAFFPAGTAIRFLPERGLEHFDFVAESKQSRDYCGCYAVTGDRVTIQWGNNDTEVATISPGTERTLKISGDAYFPVPAANGLTLDGTYRREGSDLAAKFIRFSPDGHFEDRGMLPLVAVDQPSGNGAYRIAKNTLTLQYADGRTVPLSFFVWPAEPGSRPGAIHVNTYRLVRAQP
ncbi:MAG TPA: hypothetical protein VKQ05_13330 [Gemmatimonadales bacterium]|nr:hypothetical protein [Gemmatimonadales bacterium]